MRSLKIGELAKADIVDALLWSEERFGQDIRMRYESLIAVALRYINLDPKQPGSHEHPELGLNVRLSKGEPCTRTMM